MVRFKFKLNRDLLKKFTPNRQDLEQVGEFAVSRIRTQTRKGRSMPNDSALKPLSKSYIEQRKRDKNLSRLTRPGRSNLTRTGQLLDSLKFTINNSRLSVTIAATGSRSGGPSNNAVSRYVTEQGRPFLGLDRKAIEQVKKILVSNLRRRFRRG